MWSLDYGPRSESALILDERRLTTVPCYSQIRFDKLQRYLNAPPPQGAGLPYAGMAFATTMPSQDLGDHNPLARGRRSFQLLATAVVHATPSSAVATSIDSTKLSVENKEKKGMTHLAHL